ncbi:hypothetical protein D3C84_819890 [compost metagenome]
MRGRQGAAADPGNAENELQHRFQAELLDEPLGHAAFGQQQGPGIGFDDIAGPHRHHHRNVEKGLGLAAGVASHVVGDRKRQGGAGDRYGNGHAQRAQDDVEVRRIEQGGEIGQGQFRGDRHGEVVEGVEALPEQAQQRTEVDRPEPDQGWHQ